MKSKQKNKIRLHRALTMLEMIISLAIIAVIFAVVLPQFRNMENSWASKRATAEAIQNGRILISYLNQNLAKAARITAVSDPCDTTGYIEFEGNDAVTYRCEIGADNIVEFGPVGSLVDLAGPVSQLQFTCYDAQDLDTPITTPEDIRFVRVEVTLTNAGPGQDQNFTASAYLRTNASQDGISKETPFEFDPLQGKTPVLAQIDSTHYLCAYTGWGNDHGWAVVLTVDTSDWTISKGPDFEYDNLQGQTPALAQIDSTHYLCAYAGPANKGTACVLIVDPADWTTSRGPEFVYKVNHGTGPALIRVNNMHYLCVYTGGSWDGWAVILIVNPGDWSITKGTDFKYNAVARTPALAQIDTSEFLCANTGLLQDGWVSILKVNTGDWTITEESTLEFDTTNGMVPELAKIDDSHFLCAYRGPNDYGYAVVLDTSGGLSAGTKHVYDSTGYASNQALAQVGTDSFLCVYSGNVDSAEKDGWTTDLRIDTGDWTVSNGSLFEWDSVNGTNPALAQIDATHYLCVYEGPDSDGWAVILNVYGELRP